MLGNLDPSLRSQLENVHLVALFKSQLLENYSFNEILVPFIRDLKLLSNVSFLITLHTVYLQPGITVDLEGQNHFVGILVALLGDTPAINKAGGFKEGVSFAFRKCRHCLATENGIQTKVRYTDRQADRHIFAYFILCSFVKMS